MTHRGMFLSLEGGEGSSKSTQIRVLKEYFESKGRTVTTTRDPGGDRISSKIREVVLHPDNTDITLTTELLLYLAARAQINENIIKPALERGEVVFCDRHVFSTVAYQCRVRKTCDEAKLWSVIETLPGLSIIPGCTIVIDIDPEIGLRRSLRRLNDENVKEGRFENLPMDFHHAVRQAYIEITQDYESMAMLVDGHGSVEEVSARIISGLKNRFPDNF